MSFQTLKVKKEIEFYKKRIQAEVVELAKEAFLLSADDFQISFDLSGHTNGIYVGVYIGGAEENCLNITTVFRGYTQPFRSRLNSKDDWKNIAKDLIEAKSKLQALKEAHVVEQNTSGVV
ncbi:MAG: hypothetical protein WCC23_17280 [Acinetobacter calcoaceticus]